MLPATKNRQSAPPVLLPPRRPMALMARLLWSLGWLVRRRSGSGPLCRLVAVAVDAAASSSRLSAMVYLLGFAATRRRRVSSKSRLILHGG